MSDIPPSDPGPPETSLPPEFHGLDPGELFARGMNTVSPTGGANRWEPPTPEELALLLPQYQIESLIGRGGMGAVYQGMQPSLERPVAIKLLPAELAADQEFVTRFQREARTLAKLHHSRIVTIYDFGQTVEGHLYFVMEYIDGTDLRKILRGPGLDADQALLVIGQICDALHAAHEQGVIHRDIKPENILITKDGYIKLADFGIARPLHEETAGALTQPHMVMGTADYMAPEQRDGHTDHRTDIFALGVMLYEMLTGQTPRGAFELPSHKMHIDVRIDEVVLRALQEAPDRRYQHASEMKTDVEHIRTTPVPSPPPPVALRKPQAAPSARRINPLALGIAASLLAALLIFVPDYNSPKRAHSASTTPSTDLRGGESSAGNATGWKSLFNGKDLSGWKGDHSVWSVRDGAITAISTFQRPENNTLLYGEQDFADFEFRCKCRILPENDHKSDASGSIGFRNPLKQNHLARELNLLTLPDGSTPAVKYVHLGTNVLRIDAGWKGIITGATYSRSATMHSISAPNDTKALPSPIPYAEWNDYAIVAKGNHIRLFFNGDQFMDITDQTVDREKSGFLTLTHIGDSRDIIQFKELQVRPLTVPPDPPQLANRAEPMMPPLINEFAFAKEDPLGSSGGATLNALTSEEASAGWKSLFDGKDLSSWRGDPDYWSVRDNAITATSTYAHPAFDSSIIYTGEKFADFELRYQCRLIPEKEHRTFQDGVLEFRGDGVKDSTFHGVMAGYLIRVSAFANSGEFTGQFTGGPNLIVSRGSKAILKDTNDPKKRTVEVIGAFPQSVGAPMQTSFEKWNEYNITALGNNFRYSMNGVPITEVTDQTAARKASGALGFGIVRGSHALIQFRNIKIRRLTATSIPQPPVSQSGDAQLVAPSGPTNTTSSALDEGGAKILAQTLIGSRWSWKTEQTGKPNPNGTVATFRADGAFVWDDERLTARFHWTWKATGLQTVELTDLHDGFQTRLTFDASFSRFQGLSRDGNSKQSGELREDTASKPSPPSIAKAAPTFTPPKISAQAEAAKSNPGSVEQALTSYLWHWQDSKSGPGNREGQFERDGSFRNPAGAGRTVYQWSSNGPNTFTLRNGKYIMLFTFNNDFTSFEGTTNPKNSRVIGTRLGPIDQMAAPSKLIVVAPHTPIPAESGTDRKAKTNSPFNPATPTPSSLQPSATPTGSPLITGGLQPSETPRGATLIQDPGDSLVSVSATGAAGSNFGSGAARMKFDATVSTRSKTPLDVKVDCYWIGLVGGKHVTGLIPGAARSGVVSSSDPIKIDVLDDTGWQRTNGRTFGVESQTGLGVYRGWVVSVHDSNGKRIGGAANLPEFQHLAP